MGIESEKEQITEEALKGGFKADANKSAIELVPPKVLLELGDLYQMGGKKYTPRNWELGMDYGRVYGAMMRHSLKWWAGEEYDQVDGQHHLISTIWGAMALRHYTLNPDKYSKFDSREAEIISAVNKGQK